MLGTQADCLHTRPGPHPATAAQVVGAQTRLRSSRAFSLMDLMVSMAVIVVLIGLMMPSLSTVREAARKVVCASNVRQIGLGIAMYADDNKGFLPPTKFANPARPRQAQAQSMMILRSGDVPESWDGLGFLYSLGYLDAPGIFYCPSHHGEHPFWRYADRWNGDIGDVVGNYHFRGSTALTIDAFQGGQAMVADGMRVQSDFNHKIGANVLRADMTVGWFSDSNRSLERLLPETDTDLDASSKVVDAWQTIDNSLSSPRAR